MMDFNEQITNEKQQHSSNSSEQPETCNPEVAGESDYKQLIKMFNQAGLTQDAQEIERKLRDLREPFLIFVVGEGKFGKSTLVNSLCGDNYAEVGRLPKTWRIDIFKRKDTEQAELFYINDHVQKTSVIEAQTICKTYETQKAQWDSDLYQVIWHLPTIQLKESVAIVDTPGFAQLQSSDDEREVSILGHEGLKVKLKDIFDAYYYRADIVLWVLNAKRLNDRDTMDAIKRLAEQKKHIIGCISYMDSIPDSKQEYVIDQAKKMYGDVIEYYIPLMHNGLTYDVSELLRELESRIIPNCRSIKEYQDLSYRRQKVSAILGWKRAYLDAVESNLREIQSIVDEINKYPITSSLSAHLPAPRFKSINRASFGSIISSFETSATKIINARISNLSQKGDLILSERKLKCIRLLQDGKSIVDTGSNIKIKSPTTSLPSADISTYLKFGFLNILTFGFQFIIGFFSLGAGILGFLLFLILTVAGVLIALALGVVITPLGSLAIIFFFLLFVAGMGKTILEFCKAKISNLSEWRTDKENELLASVYYKVTKKTEGILISKKNAYLRTVEESLFELVSDYMGMKSSTTASKRTQNELKKEIEFLSDWQKRLNHELEASKYNLGN